MNETKAKVGAIGWTDLTVEHAESIRDFYGKVVGWGNSPVDMGGYSDYCMLQPESGEAVAGVCHARGANADLPPVWMVYLMVADLKASMAQVKALGGKILAGPKKMGGGGYCVIRDPAGAISALFQAE